MPVIVQVNGHPTNPWRINMMPVGNGDFYLYLHGDVRKVSGTKVGDVVTVEVSFDTTYKAGPEPLPPLLRLALKDNKVASTNWNRLSPSRKKEAVRSLNRLKSKAALTKNLEQAIHVLSGNEGRFMGRSWNDGS